MAGWKPNAIFYILPVAASAIFIALTMHCSVEELAGGSSEIGNGRVIGRVVNEQGYPACSTIVSIMPSNYDPLKNGPLADTCIDTTDADGMYRFVARQGQTFSIQAVHMALRTRVIVTGMEMKNADLNVPQCTLKVPGSIKVSLPDGIDPLFGYVYVPGSEIFAFFNNSVGFVTLDSVPAGTIPAVYYSSTANSTSTIIRYDVPVISGTTTIVYNPSWKYARRLVLNTTAGGANVSGDVSNFPVLVRLTSGNFTFAQAKADGGDLRFSKSDGTSLPYQIESWDPVAGLAEAWVKADTVHGADSTQLLIMYWGNGNAADGSNGAAVFDSSNGFEGVWHLNESSGTRAADASYNGFSGVYMDKLPKNAAGPFGSCQYFAPSDSDFVDMGDVLNPAMKNITIGVWIKRASFGLPQALIAKTIGGAPSSSYGYQLSIDQANFPHFFMASGATSWGNDSAFDIASNLAISDSTAWHFVLVAIDRSINGNCKVYVDGIDRTGGAYGNVAHVNNLTNTLRLRIGSENNTYHYYRGAIAEATIAFNVRSADWVKLSCMNQKEQDALVKW